jgi:hypothetical protein
MYRICLVVALLMAASPALAQDWSGLLDTAFANTIVSTYPDGRTAKLWLEPGGVYTAEGREHEPTNGRWRVENDKLCLKQMHPFAFGFVYCTLLSKFSSGTTWTSRAVTGETIQIRLVRGRT